MSRHKHNNSYHSYKKEDEIPNSIDMHVHTIRSIDGGLSVKKVLNHALSNKITHLAIADHNRIDGVKKALRFMEASEDYNSINLIPGVEISCYDKEAKAKFHLLVYGFDVNNQALNDRLLEIQKGEKEHYYGLFAILEKSFGIQFSPYEIKKAAAMNEEITLDVIAEMAVLHIDENGKPAPYATSKDDFLAYIKQAWSTNKHHTKLKNKLMLDIDYLNLEHLEETKLPTLEEILPIIREAGGVPVLAHPKHIKFYNADGARIRYENENLNEKQEHDLRVRNFVEWFKNKTTMHHLDAGMEVFFAAEAFRYQYYLDLANEFGLIASGGSDFHGAHKSKNHRIGTVSNRFHITKLPIVTYFKNGRNKQSAPNPINASTCIEYISSKVRKTYASKNEGILAKRQLKKVTNMQAVLNQFGTSPMPVYRLHDRTLNIKRRSTLLKQEKDIYHLIKADQNLVTKAEKDKHTCMKNLKALEKNYYKFYFTFKRYEQNIQKFETYDKLENKDKFSSYLTNTLATLKQDYLHQLHRRKEMYTKFNIDIKEESKKFKHKKNVTQKTEEKQN
jgi:predicted metal-dependent phosphoesterase TrpH